VCRIFSVIGTCAVFCFSTDKLQQPAPRESYDVNLPKIVIGMDESSGMCSRVRIIFDKSDDYYVIADNDDMFVNMTKNGTEKKVYRESSTKSYQMSNFEAEQISKVCGQFTEALRSFEKNLQSEKWGRCLYFDAYFPNFLNGFYYMVLLARCSYEDIPREAKIADSLYDISMNSIKSDLRIRKWRMSKEHVVSLRIAAKELAFEINEWQKKELNNSKRDPNIANDTGFFKALIFFEQIYFNKSNKLSLPK